MNWILIIVCCLIITGSFIAISYDYIATRNNFGVGELFQRKGTIHFTSGIIGIGTIAYLGFMSEWWTVPIAIAVGWIGSQMLITTLRTTAQLLSLALMLGGLAYLILRL